VAGGGEDKEEVLFPEEEKTVPGKEDTSPHSFRREKKKERENLHFHDRKRKGEPEEKSVMPMSTKEEEPIKISQYCVMERKKKVAEKGRWEARM